MKYCQKCNKPIPENRSICDTCYNIELTKYNEKLINYNENTQKWNLLSSQQKALSHIRAEIGNLQLYSFFFGFSILAIIALLNMDKISHLYFWKKLLPFIIGYTILHYFFYSYIGRLIRGILSALVFGAIFAFLGFIISSFFQLNNSNMFPHAIQQVNNILEMQKILYFRISSVSQFLSFIGFLIGIIIGIIKELTGKNHATATPQRPQKPNP